jgi:sigma-B regulation protein RsbU (phosphoserine phosphatase)
MATLSVPSNLIFLQPLAGPPLQPLRIQGDRPVTLGRSSECEVRLENPVVSKRHASLARLGESWIIRDLGSRHGTHVNGVPLTPQQAVPLSEGDLVVIRPWVFRVRMREPDPSTMITIDRPHAEGDQIERLPPSHTEFGVREQYAQLISASGAIFGAADEEGLVSAIIDRALAGSGFHRGAVLRQSAGDAAAGGKGGDVEIVAAIDRARRDGGRFEFSRSLISAASTGSPAVLIAPRSPVPENSVVRLNITRALCLPILVESSVWGYLYLDSRRGEAPPRDDAIGFCGAIVEMAGLALASLKARELRERLQTLQGDIEAAAQVQRMIMPPAQGEFGPLRYAVRSQPGRLLSGDLFDVVPLEDGRVAVALGDVTGKGVGAAFLMAVAQTLVRSYVTRCDDPAEVLDSLNAYLSRLHAGPRFISLWLGIFDPRGRRVTVADAGHGYAVLAGAGRSPVRLQCAGGPVVGAVAGCRYERAECEWPAGARVILFSDGLAEQAGDLGEQFGLQRILESVVADASPQGDVDGLFEALRSHARTDAFTDDVTIASVQAS